MPGTQMPFAGAQPQAPAGFPGAEILTGQILQLTDTIEAMRGEMDQMNAEINRLQRRGRDDGGYGQREKKDEDIVDRKFFTPDAFGSGSIFREWKTEFEDFIAGRDKELAKKLERAEKEKEVITSLGNSDPDIERAEKLFRVNPQACRPVGGQEYRRACAGQ